MFTNKSLPHHHHHHHHHHCHYSILLYVISSRYSIVQHKKINSKVREWITLSRLYDSNNNYRRLTGTNRRKLKGAFNHHTHPRSTLQSPYTRNGKLETDTNRQTDRQSPRPLPTERMHSASARPSTPTPLPGARRTTSSLSSQLAASLPPPHTAAIAPPVPAAHADKKLSESQSDRVASTTATSNSTAPAASTNNSINNNSSTPSSSTATGAGATSAPFTPRRLNFPGRLSLQMPSRGPLSPVLDPALGYSVARRPRLDFARACMIASFTSFS